MRSNDKITSTVAIAVTDVGVTAILAVPDTVDSGTVVTPGARVRNFGTAAEGFRVRLTIGTSYTQEESVYVAPGDSAPVAFPQWTGLERGPAAVRCSTCLVGDMRPQNDFLTAMGLSASGMSGLRRLSPRWGRLTLARQSSPKPG